MSSGIKLQVNRLVITFFCFSVGGAIAQVLVSLTGLSWRISTWYPPQALPEVLLLSVPLLLFMRHWFLAAAGVTAVVDAVAGHWEAGHVCHVQRH